MSKHPLIKTATQIAHIREAGKLLNELLVLIARAATPGTKLITLEMQAEAFLAKHDVTGAFKGFHGFPANLCLSLNACVVHGIPDETVLKAGDLLKIDSGVIYQGGVADAAISVVVGGNAKNPAGAKLIQCTKQALDAGVATIAPHTSCMPFAQTVQKTMIMGGCTILKGLTGHGVGIEVHEPPHLYNRPHESMHTLTWTPGRVVALEPITAQKSTEFKERPGNSRNLYTTKGDLGAQREYTVAITPDGYEILAGIVDARLII